MSILDGQNFTSTNLTTDEDGLFYFKGFDLPDSTEILIQGNIHNPKKKGKLSKGEAKRIGNKINDNLNRTQSKIRNRI